jgi:hypothetical protein
VTSSTLLEKYGHTLRLIGKEIEWWPSHGGDLTCHNIACILGDMKAWLDEHSTV